MKQQFKVPHLQAFDEILEKALPLNDVALDEFTATYLAISNLHIENPNGTTGALHHIPTTTELVLRSRIFARRTFAALRELPIPPIGARRVIEHGAGLAPGLLSASNPEELVAIEAVRGYEATREVIFSTAQLPIPRTQLPEADGTPETHLFTYSLYEIARGDPCLALEHLRALSHRAQRILILEPGDHTHSKFLQSLRDAWTADTSVPLRISSPCPARTSKCPLPHRDWCHFSYDYDPGEFARRILHRIGRRGHRLHVSYLDLELNPASSPPHTRTLAVFHEGRAKARATVCTEEGLHQLIALKRHRPAYERLLRLRPGTPLQLDIHTLTRKGDGLRIEDPSHLGDEQL